jgi:hypothetical protein
MSSLRATTTLRQLRSQPLWRLLAADKAPAVLAMLQTLLFEADKALPGSVLLERLTRELELQRSLGEDFPQGPAAYLADWLGQGWVTRRFPPGAPEEEYSLTTDAAAAIRFMATLLRPRVSATESRLATVISQLSRLAEETDANPRSRMEALLAERERIDREIDAVSRGAIKTLAPERALERTREIIALADELMGDFRRVRDDFAKLNMSLRESLLENEESRGTVLEALFAGVDLIAESESGKTFAAFWRLLTDPDQSATFELALTDVMSRPFSRALEPAERRFLLRLTGALTDEGGGVHDVLQHFARSLKSFVQSSEYLEQRRLHSLLKAAQKAAVVAKDAGRVNAAVGYSLALTSSRIRSVSQWSLYDPTERAVDVTMVDAPAADISLDEVGELVRQSEIDMRTLKAHITQALSQSSQVSIADLLRDFPAEQGLGSVVGYIALGVKFGEVAQTPLTVAWTGTDGMGREATVPGVYFLKERLHELN